MEIVLMENWFFLEEDKSLALFTLSKQDSKGNFRDLLLDYCLLQVLTKNSHWVQVASRFVLLQRESTTTTCIRNFNSGFLAPPDTFMGTIYSVLRGQEISNSQPPTQVTSSVNNYSGIALVWLLLKLGCDSLFYFYFHHKFFNNEAVSWHKNLRCMSVPMTDLQVFRTTQDPANCVSTQALQVDTNTAW